MNPYKYQEASRVDGIYQREKQFPTIPFSSHDDLYYQYTQIE